MRRLPLYTLFSNIFANLRFFTYSVVMVIVFMQHFVAKMQQKQFCSNKLTVYSVLFEINFMPWADAIAIEGYSHPKRFDN